jgi:hypothetical protein
MLRGAKIFAPLNKEVVECQRIIRQEPKCARVGVGTKKPGGRAGLVTIFGLHLFNSVAEFVVVEIHACAVAAEEAVVQKDYFFAPDLEEGFSAFVIHAPEVSVAHFVEAVGQEDHLVALENAVSGRVADPDAVYIAAYMIAIPEDLTVCYAENYFVPYADRPVVPVKNMAYGTRMSYVAVVVGASAVVMTNRAVADVVTATMVAAVIAAGHMAGAAMAATAVAAVMIAAGAHCAAAVAVAGITGMAAGMISALADCTAGTGSATSMGRAAGADRAARTRNTAAVMAAASGHTCGAVSAGGTRALTTYSGATAMASTLNRGA